MKKKGKFVSIQTKIYRILFLMITIGTVLCSLGTFGVLHKSILEKSKMDYQMLVKNVMFSLNSNVEDIIRCSELILTNKDILAYLQNTYNQKRDYYYFLAQSNVENEVKNIIAMNSDLVESIEIMDRKAEMNSQIVKGFFWQNENLYYCGPFIGEKADQEIGRLVVSIREKELFSSLTALDPESLRVSLSDLSDNYIWGNTEGGNEWEMINQERIENSEWIMTARINKNILEKSIWEVLYTIIILLVSVLAASYFIFKPVLRRITEPLLALTREIKEFKEDGEKITNFTEVSNDEVGMIAVEYEHLVNRLQKLIRRLKKQKETEIHLYMAKINPHFIYNTLYALICVAEKKHETEIAQKIEGVTNILCLSLYSKPESSHTVREEIEAINQYLDILKYKYGEGILVEWNLEPGMEEESIHVLLLYPLVENAVFHGLSQIQDKHLIITFEENPEEKRICVEDNGIGMSREEIYTVYNRFEKWLNKIEEEELDEEENIHMGLLNLRLRLYFLYGDDAALTIESQKGKGTKVVIQIRKKR